METRESFVSNNYESDRSLKLRDKQVASDGTTKYLFALEDGSLIESVLMQFDYGKSICVTSQVGCNMACAFCASGLTKKETQPDKRRDGCHRCCMCSVI